VPQKITNQPKNQVKTNPIDVPNRSLRTCFAAALTLGVGSFQISAGQQPYQLGPDSPTTVNAQTDPVAPTVEPNTVETAMPFTQEPLVSPEIDLNPSPSDSYAQIIPGSEYPYPSVPPAVIIPHPLERSGLISGDNQNIKMLEPEDVLPTTIDLYDLSLERYTSYRGKESLIGYMPGDGDQFGWLSFDSSNYLTRGAHHGANSNFNMHLLSGPLAVPLPPRLYDFELGYQARNSLSDLFSYEWSAMVGVYSDFEDSARDGVRFPAHAVGMFHPGPRVDWVIGVDYLGRDDIHVLPVAGFVWHDPQRPELRYEMVFPRPRIDLTLNTDSRIYCRGLLGGGTWDIEFPDDSNDVVTYRDYRLLFGIEHADADGDLSSWELGWVFSRKLEFRERVDEYGLGDAFVIRYVTRK
jgi:hypothetical protein